jgi:hypothetical protein
MEQIKISEQEFKSLPPEKQQEYIPVYLKNTGYGVTDAVKWEVTDEADYNRHNYSYRKIEYLHCSWPQFYAGLNAKQPPVAEVETVSKTTGSDIGSGHWFNTLMASIKHTGEYLMDNKPPNDDILKVWGKLVYERSNELLNWFESNDIGKHGAAWKEAQLSSIIAGKDAEIERLKEFLSAIMECSGTSQLQYQLAAKALKINHPT